jgi:hypothetical protein
MITAYFIVNAAALLVMLLYVRRVVGRRAIDRDDAYLAGRTYGYREGAQRAENASWMAGYDEGVKSSGVRKRTPEGKFATDAAWRAEKQ